MASSRGSRARAAGQRQRYYDLREEGHTPVAALAIIDPALSLSSSYRYEHWYQAERRPPPPAPVAATARRNSRDRRSAAQEFGLPSPWN